MDEILPSVDEACYCHSEERLKRVRPSTPKTRTDAFFSYNLLLALKIFTSLPSFSNNKIFYVPNCFGIVFFRNKKKKLSRKSSLISWKNGSADGNAESTTACADGGSGNSSFQADASHKLFFFWPPERIVLVMDERIT